MRTLTRQRGSIPLLLATALLGVAGRAGAQTEPPAPEPPAPEPAAETAPAPEPPPPPPEGALDVGEPPTTEAAPVERATPPSPVSRRGQATGDEDSWKFSFHGYLRAPMRIGVGKRVPADQNGLEVEGQSDTTLHEPIIPDDQYLSFQNTRHNQRSWGEAYFGFGNAWASATLGLRALNFTEGSASDPDTQLGINQAFVTITPDLDSRTVGLWVKAGAMSDGYGSAGRYDSGELDTYLFGRTHVVGETLHVDLHLADPWSIYIEHGIGTHRPDPSVYNDTRYTLLHHAHVGARMSDSLEVAAHYLYAWSQEEFRPMANIYADPAQPAAARNGLPTGKLWTAGLEARADLGSYGYLYGGFSHTNADYALTVSRAYDVLSASGGGEFGYGVARNYLDSPGCSFVPGNAPPVPMTPTPPQNWRSLDPNGCSDGNGTINAILAQYELGVMNLINQTGSSRLSEGLDVRVALYGLVALVNSEARDTTAIEGPLNMATPEDGDYSITKMKLGTDVLVQATDWLSPALRFDHVSPNSKISEQAFSVLSPRVEFKTAWLTRERITLQYSRYLYSERECASDSLLDFGYYQCTQPPSQPNPYDGFGSDPANRYVQDAGSRAVNGAPTLPTAMPAYNVQPHRLPDVNVFKVEATMWW